MKLPRSYVTKEVWRHNGFRGSVRMAHVLMDSIRLSKTATPEAKICANEAKLWLRRLQQQLATRDDSSANDYRSPK